MADDKRNTSSERRRRPAPTIDLSATEVKPADPPPSQHTEKEEKPGRAEAAPGKRLIVLALLVGMAVGAAEVLGGLWLAGALGGGSTPDNLAPRIAALEAQVAAVPKPPDSSALADLGARIGKLEQAVTRLPANSPDPASGERLAAIENAIKALGLTLSALNRRAEESTAALTAARERADAAAKTAEAIQARLAAIERAAKAAEDKVAQNSGTDAVARRALAAVALRDAVARGTSYADELAIAKQLGADSAAIAALNPFANSGVPTEAALSQELSSLLPKMMDATGADAAKAGGFFERLQANAGGLVRVHPIGEPRGDDPSAVLARIEVKTSRNDLTGIDREVDKLPPKARLLTEEWRKNFAARNAAVAASRKLAADAATALGAN